MLKFIDIHNHILPGVDDGSPDMDTSMEMLSLAYDEGIRRMICTPHFIHGHNMYTPEQLDLLFREFRYKAKKEFPGMTFYLGNEIYYMSCVTERDLNHGLIHTMAGTRFVLVEFSTDVRYGEIYQALMNLMQLGYIPIIAHVERYQCLVEHMHLIDELRQSGVLLQLNAHGVLGNRLSPVTRWRRRLVKEGKISFLGTDAHHIQYRAPFIQKPGEWVTRHLDKENCQDLFWRNAKHMLKEEYAKF